MSDGFYIQCKIHGRQEHILGDNPPRCKLCEALEIEAEEYYEQNKF
jgi:hypothetical protein